MKARGKHVIYALVLLVAGFIIAFSYQFTKSETIPSQESEKQWEREDKLRDEILEVQKENSRLIDRLNELQQAVQEIERNQAEQEKRTYNLVEDLDNLRMITGTVKVRGSGVLVTLHDANYVPEGENPNQYIVHEEHLQKVISELYVIGAEAIAINGKRISHNSYIVCVGPVVEVDGEKFFAPFEISAIGDADLMVDSLNLTGNTKDQLVENGIEVTIEKKDDIVMDPF